MSYCGSAPTKFLTASEHGRMVTMKSPESAPTNTHASAPTSTHAHKEVKTVNASRSRIVTSLAGAAALALVVTGCSSADSGDAGDAGDNEKITLTITTFGTMGVETAYEQYMKDHPNITIEATNL